MPNKDYEVSKLLGAIDSFTSSLVDLTNEGQDQVIINHSDLGVLSLLEDIVDLHEYLTCHIDDGKLIICFPYPDKEEKQEIEESSVEEKPSTPIHPLQNVVRTQLPNIDKESEIELGDVIQEPIPKQTSPAEKLGEPALTAEELEEKKRKAEESKRKAAEKKAQEEADFAEATDRAYKESKFLQKFDPDSKFRCIRNDFQLENKNLFKQLSNEELVAHIHEIDSFPIYIHRMKTEDWDKLSHGQLLDVALNLGTIYGRIKYCHIYAYGSDTERRRFVGTTHLQLMASVNPHYYSVKESMRLTPDTWSNLFLAHYRSVFSESTELARLTSGFLAFENGDFADAFTHLMGYFSKHGLRVLLREWISENEVAAYFKNEMMSIPGHGIFLECIQIYKLPNIIKTQLADHAKYVDYVPIQGRSLSVSKAPGKYDYAFFLAHFLSMERIRCLESKRPELFKPKIKEEKKQRNEEVKTQADAA